MHLVRFDLERIGLHILPDTPPREVSGVARDFDPADDDFEWGGVFAMNPKRKFLTDAEYAELVAAIKSAL